MLDLSLTTHIRTRLCIRIRAHHQTASREAAITAEPFLPIPLI